MTTPPPAPTWTPINSYDNFTPDPVGPNPWGVVPPPYQANGQWPSVTGIPADNPATLCVKLCRIVDVGSSDGTYKVRTQDGWLLDDFTPHTTTQLGYFIYVLFCGTWCVDLTCDQFLPMTPVPPSTYVEPTDGGTG